MCLVARHRRVLTCVDVGTGVDEKGDGDEQREDLLGGSKREFPGRVTHDDDDDGLPCRPFHYLRCATE